MQTLGQTARNGKSPHALRKGSARELEVASGAFGARSQMIIQRVCPLNHHLARNPHQLLLYPNRHWHLLSECYEHSNGGTDLVHLKMIYAVSGKIRVTIMRNGTNASNASDSFTNQSASASETHSGAAGPTPNRGKTSPAQLTSFRGSM